MGGKRMSLPEKNLLNRGRSPQMSRETKPRTGGVSRGHSTK
mgnify:CR=1 FL=1